MAKPLKYCLDCTQSPQKKEDNNTILTSKSAMKRYAQIPRKIGGQLVELSTHELEYIPLDTQLLDSIKLARHIKRNGRRRQLQFISKLLRIRDISPIANALDKLKNRHNQQSAILYKLEDLRMRLLKNGNDVIEEVIILFPGIDRQKVKALVRNAKKEFSDKKTSKAFHQIFQYLKELSEIS
ncbi:hypothetical protein GFV14_00433 [Candidatus Hartigia pinicola]|nr:hypothetical protein GFV14_00433 [Candidatus Hartigia pinicola]